MTRKGVFFHTSMVKIYVIRQQKVSSHKNMSFFNKAVRSSKNRRFSCRESRSHPTVTRFVEIVILSVQVLVWRNAVVACFFLHFLCKDFNMGEKVNEMSSGRFTFLFSFFFRLLLPPSQPSLLLCVSQHDSLILEIKQASYLILCLRRGELEEGRREAAASHHHPSHRWAATPLCLRKW